MSAPFIQRETTQQRADRLLVEDRERRARPVGEPQFAEDEDLRPCDPVAVMRGIAHALAITVAAALVVALVAHAVKAW